MDSNYRFSADIADVDRDQVHRWISEQSYWAPGRSHARQDAAIDGSRNFGIVRLDGLQPQLRLEIRYVLQRRRDDGGTTCPPAVVLQVVRFLVEAGEGSLLALTEPVWASRIGPSAPLYSNPRALLVYGRRQIEDLTRVGGWDDEYDHDVWQLRRLGFAGNPTLTFDSIG